MILSGAYFVCSLVEWFNNLWKGDSFCAPSTSLSSFDLNAIQKEARLSGKFELCLGSHASSNSEGAKRHDISFFLTYFTGTCSHHLLRPTLIRYCRMSRSRVFVVSLNNYWSVAKIWNVSQSIVKHSYIF